MTRLRGAERRERDAEIVERRKRGARVKDLDAIYGEGIVKRALREGGVTEPRGGSNRYSEETWAAIETFLRDEGGSYLEASRTFGPGETTIARRFPDLGWTRAEAARYAAEVTKLNRMFEKTTYA